MSLVSLDIVKYASKNLIGAGLIYGFDVFNGAKYSSSIVMYDAAVMGGSVLTSELLKDLIVGMLGVHNDSLQYKLIEPLLNAFVYSYMYNFFVASKFPQLTKRTQMNNLILSGAISMLLIYFENPIIGLFTGIKNF